MPSIIIKEANKTLGSNELGVTDIVYIPGLRCEPFSTSSESDESTDNYEYYTAADGTTKIYYADEIPKFTPTLCTNPAIFKRYFGNKPCTIQVGDDQSKTIQDKSYIYALELLSLGLPVLYEALNDRVKKPDTPATPATAAEGGDGETTTTPGTTENTTHDAVVNINAVYNLMLTGTTDGKGSECIYTKLADKGEYDFKYITSGGYANYGYSYISKGNKSVSDDKVLSTNMATLASTRQDCIALIDHTDNEDMVLSGTGSMIDAVQKMDNEYAAIFTPWINIDSTVPNVGTTSMPPSFAYLTALAKSLKTNVNWLAIAGATRGQIPNINAKRPLNINKVLTNSIAEKDYQSRGLPTEKSVSINAITNIKPFGYRIWGNRTLKNNTNTNGLTATSFLNTRNMISDIKKLAYRTCKRFMFEQNNDTLWLNFKSAIEPTLDKMKLGAGLSGYKIIQEPTSEKGKLKATIKLIPLYAVEDFEITVAIEDDTVSVS